MMNEKNISDDILKSWAKNAGEWNRVLDEQIIESRKHTNASIADTVRSYHLSSILDFGCGEGWLTRALSSDDCMVYGADAIEELLILARSKGGQKYFKLSFEEVIKGDLIPGSPYEGVIFNFCLYLNEGLPQLLKQTSNHLTNDGLIFIQTLHPVMIRELNIPYKSQWIDDAWKGLPGHFSDGHPWYARTFSDWFETFQKASLILCELKEVVNAEGKPLSVIFILKRNQ